MKRKTFQRIDNKLRYIFKESKSECIASNKQLGISMYADIPKYDLTEPRFKLYNNADRRFATKICIVSMLANEILNPYNLPRGQDITMAFRLTNIQVMWVNIILSKIRDNEPKTKSEQYLHDQLNNLESVRYTQFALNKYCHRTERRMYAISNNLTETEAMDMLVYADEKYYIICHPSDIAKDLINFKVFEAKYLSKMCRLSIFDSKYVVSGDDCVMPWILSTKEEKELTHIFRDVLDCDYVMDDYNFQLHPEYYGINKISLDQFPDYTLLPKYPHVKLCKNYDRIFDVCDGERYYEYGVVSYDELEDMSFFIYPNDNKDLHYFVLVIDHYKVLQYEYVRINMDKPEYMTTIKSPYRNQYILTKDERDHLVHRLNSYDGYIWNRICDCYNELTGQNIVFEKPDYTKLISKED